MNKVELKAFVDYKTDGKAVEDDSLRIRIEDAEIWVQQLGGLTYLLSQLLAKYSEDPNGGMQLISMLYELEDSMNFSLHECDIEFVQFMLRNLRDREIELADELVALQSHLALYEYGTSLRFGQ